jgi:hypothetical protein
MCFASVRPKTGAHDQDRTDDLILTKDVLCQLSYMGDRRRIPTLNDKKPKNPNTIHEVDWD